MKKTTAYIIGIILLVIIAVLFYLKDEKNTLDASVSDFALEKEEAPDSLVLKQDSLVSTLSLQHGKWMLNNRYHAREKAVNQLFNVLQDIQVESPATQSSKKTVLELVRENPLHIKIYRKGIKIKDFLVEDSQMKKGTTYMLMSGANEPFLMNLPGYNGDIALLLRADPDYWRDKTLFDYSGIDISKVEVIYPEKKSKSFILTYNKKDQFVLNNAFKKGGIEKVNTSKAARYLSYFSNIFYEKILVHSEELKDSLKKETPYCIISVEDVNGKTKTLNTFRKLSEGQKDEFGQESYYDLNHLYGVFNEFGDILLIKYTEIDPLFKEIDYFRVE